MHAQYVLTFWRPKVHVACGYFDFALMIFVPENFLYSFSERRQWTSNAAFRLLRRVCSWTFSCTKYSLCIRSCARSFRYSIWGLGSLWVTKYASARLTLTSVTAKRKENGRCGQYFVAHTCSKQMGECLLPL